MISVDTYSSLVHLLEVQKDALHFLSGDKNGILACNTNLFAVTIIDIAQSDIGRVILKQAKIGAARYGGRYMEIEVALTRLFLSRKCPAKDTL